MSGSSSDESVGILAAAGIASAITEAADAPFHASLSDIPGEDLQLLVAQRVTSRSFSAWFVAGVTVYFDALEGQKVKLQRLTIRTVIMHRGVIPLCFSNTRTVPLCCRNTVSSHGARWRSCPQNESAAASHPGRASDNLLLRVP